MQTSRRRVSLIVISVMMIIAVILYMNSVESADDAQRGHDEDVRTVDPENTIVIVHAWYGVFGRIEDDHGGQVVERLRANIDQNHGRLVVTGNLNDFFGFDPAPNDAKIAAIHLRYNGKDHHFQFSEGQTLEFPKADV